MRKLLVTLLLLPLLPVLLAGCSAEPSSTAATQTAPTAPTTSGTPDQVSVTIGMSYIPNIQFAPFYVAETDGLFNGVGAQVTLRHHGSSEGLFTAIGADQEQFVIAGGDEALQAREQGVDLVAVGSYYRRYPVRIIALADSGIATLADLRGKRIGIPGRYGESWFGLLVALQSAALSEDDVEILEIGYTANAALSTDKVDAVVGFSNNDFVQFQLAGMNVIELPLTSAGNPPLVGASILTTRAFLDQHPQVAKAVVEAIVAGIKATSDDPARAVEIAANYVPGLTEESAAEAARATLDATLEVMRDDSGVISAGLSEDWAAMAEFLLEAGVLTKPADLSAAVADVTAESP
jgi:NitT/TauT family transport system substrate-binding protein